MLKSIPLLVTAVLALPGPVLAQDAGAVLRIIEAQDQIVRIQAKTRHTTVIVLPAAEDILDFVVGDSEYWHLTGAANLAFLKPIAEGVATNVALVCASGRIYSFLVTEASAGEPHLIVRVESPQIDDPRISPGVNTPAFVRRSQVTAYQEMAETAMQTVATVQEEAEVRVAEAKARAGAGQGLGQAAEQILQRFLNRLPTLTIRAGHRLRIWFTSDVLVPRNLKGE